MMLALLRCHGIEQGHALSELADGGMIVEG